MSYPIDINSTNGIENNMINAPEPTQTLNRNHDDSKQEERICAICHETLSTQPYRARQPCLHEFHIACDDEWIRQGPEPSPCPTCRRMGNDGIENETEEEHEDRAYVRRMGSFFLSGTGLLVGSALLFEFADDCPEPIYAMTGAWVTLSFGLGCMYAVFRMCCDRIRDRN